MSEGEFCAQARVPGPFSFVWGPRRKVDLYAQARVPGVLSRQFSDIPGGTRILIVYHYLRVPGWFFCGSFLMLSAAWLAGLADRLAWQNCSVAVSWASPGG